MKLRHFLLLLLAIPMAASAAADAPRHAFMTLTNSYRHFEAGKPNIRSFRTTVYIEEIPTEPTWSLKEEHPPLSPRKAMKIAEDYVVDLLGSPPEMGPWLGRNVPNATARSKIAEDHVMDLLGAPRVGPWFERDVVAAAARSVTLTTAPHNWFYIVKVVPLHSGTGNTQTFDVVVFMDGTVPKPVEIAPEK